MSQSANLRANSPSEETPEIALGTATGKSLRTTHFIFIAAVILSVAGIIVGSYYFLDNLNQKNAQFRELVNKTRLAQTTFKTQVQEWKNTLLRGNNKKDFDKYSSRMQKNSQVVNSILTQVKDRVRDESLLQRIDGLAKENLRIVSAYTKALAGYKNDDIASAIKIDRKVRGIDRQLNQDFNGVTADLLNYAETESSMLYSQALTMLIILSIVGSLLITVLMIRNYNDIARPLNILRTKLIEIIDTKNLRTKIPDLKFKELNQVASSTTFLLGHLRKMIKEMDTVCTGVEKLAAKLVDNSNSLKVAGEETAHQAELISSSAEEMNYTVQTIATSIEEMSMSVEELSRRTHEASGVSSNAESITTATNSIIVDLGDRAREISGISEAISELARQTSLLALNASIEAASAGDAGKGFDVVAKEVKALASESAGSTERIRSQIEGIQSKVGETTTSLGEISTVVRKINSITATLASTIQQQSIATKEISGNTQGMSTASNDVTTNIAMIASASQTNLESIGQIGEMAAELNNYSGQLKEMSGTFKA